MKKPFAIALTILCSAAANALPLVWRADWPGSKPVETLVHRGTDIEFQPQWYINGELANSTNWTFTTFVQTNSQATGEWFGPLPGAAFSHTNDIGAAFYNVMVRAQMPGGGVNYTAFARLRMLDSPGYTPGELPLPVSTIDFSKVVALNAPWLLPSATNDLASIRVELGSNSVAIATNAAAISTNAANIATLNDTTSTLSNTTATINSKIPSAASASNQLADKEWIDDEIDTYAAYYITATAQGAAFATYAALTNATVYYSAGAVRVPTRNDYCVVLADETHGGAEWRYIYAVADGATTGQWEAQYPIETNDYEALSNKPQINGHTLTNNQTGAALGLLDLSGGEMTGAINFDDTAYLKFNTPTDHAWGTIQFAYWSPEEQNSFVFQHFLNGTTWTAMLPHKNGTLAFEGDISAAALAATNYTDAALSNAITPSNTTFSNAVLSVGIGIDTNTVAVINELVDSAHDLPVTGATSVGALLLALAAAVAALKKRLPYALVAKTIENGAVTLDDRASNAVTVSATLSPNTLTINFPAATSGKVRDFALRLNIASGVTAPELVLPQGVVCENADGEVPEISDGGTGGSSTILYFSETENNGTTAKFLLKGETLAAITQA